MAEVMREQLVSALTGFFVWIKPDHTQNVEASKVFGTVADPELFADELLGLLAPGAQHKGRPWIADTEVAVIGRMVADLEAVSDTVPGVASGAAWRVLHYLADRFGYVLATED